MNLDRIEILKKSGEEKFSEGNKELNMSIIDFWSWSTSDILGNAMRGVLAEFIVASELGITEECRVEWDAYDLITKDGIKIEIKSSAYLQSWKQKKLSDIGFDISPTRALDFETNIYSDEKKRQADIYFFCLLAHKDKNTVNPLNLSQWEFYILDSNTLDEKVPLQKRIGLNSLLKLKPVKVQYGEIRNTIDLIFKKKKL